MKRVLAALVVALVAALLFYGYYSRSDQTWLLCLLASFPGLLYLVWQGMPRPSSETNRTLQRLGGTLIACFMLISVHLLYQQVVAAPAIRLKIGSQGTDNPISDPRRADAELRVRRGRIFAAGGQPIADTTVLPDGYVARSYPNSYTGYLAGYYSPLRFGNFGLENLYDDYLSGRKGNNPLLEAENNLLHRPTYGSDLYLTLQADVQEVAQDALAGCGGPQRGVCRGAVVVLDVQTGAVLAMASNPRFDPSQIAADPASDPKAERDRITAYWNGLVNDPSNPLVLRATAGRYPPGSTFKTVTLVAGLDTGKYTLTSPFTDPGQVSLNNQTVYDCTTCRPAGTGPRYSLVEGYKWSLNVVFATIANDLGAGEMAKYISSFYISRDLRADFDLATSSLCSTAAPTDIQCILSGPEAKNLNVASSYGQGQLQVTPLHMALIAATVGRGGELPRPYLVDHISQHPTSEGQLGRVLQKTSPQVLTRVMTPQTASTARQAMYTGVQSGWANGAAIPGWVVGGKTGTAETGRGTNHAWFIAIMGKDAGSPQYAICAMIENGGEGSSYAMPIAKRVMTYIAGRK